ncbi:KpsF/GutQ family sugar-phosphate isomerase [Bartonella tamiae]|uniref:KpsF/GutQ family sugar isomerase n=1 Tax=Bartonella tamiae Th239 TaxID=1094558 RepID=J0QWP1_9HYPH|nr:KpsF/GutQ family sugar-phosphate isomerase [Bartonella tamiae]EJF90421.1 KpsF/GutQ family sugar isomerase [Bartonella tamiae Th239]EJF93635.1 KpsF/GutQ family sugar isomerase [Bartonella tamiae Th307]
MTLKDKTQILFDKAIASAHHTLSVERDGLQALLVAFDQGLKNAFFRAVDTILSSKGRVIVTGLGKSGHVGTKIAATLASTGTPSFFVHAAEANHGDLGMIGVDDVILALSWSGETVELSGILNHAARFRIPLIALTSGEKSALGRASDIVLLLPKAEEACPHGLAPTTSTTLQMAFGDALAVALLEMRGFSARDFKIYHPGGSLGARLKYIEDIMHQGEAMPLVLSQTDMKSAMHVLVSKHFGCVGIVNDQNQLIGIVTDGDLARNIHRDLSGLVIDEIMTKNPKTISADMVAGAAAAIINDYKIGALFVVDNQKPIGLVHFHDLLHIGAL